MPISQQELGRRLKEAREACRFTQEEVARELGFSRSTVAQIELGNRAVSGLELDRLAELFGRDMGSFLLREAKPQDALTAIFRAHPEVSGEREVGKALRRSVNLGRELTHLEQLLGIDRSQTDPPAYQLPPPRNRWHAIQQGEQVAERERCRLELGHAPLPDLIRLLGSLGVRLAQVDLPPDVSGITLIEPDLGVLVVVNRSHHVLRRRFSCAHEYAHVLFDRDLRGLISQERNRNELLEIRANAFAACFLMPAEGVRHFVHGLGKGRASRLRAEVFDVFGEGREPSPNPRVVRVEARSQPGSQTLQLYDVVQLAHHFRVSRLSAIYRLRNLRLIDEARLAELLEQEQQGMGRALAEALGLLEKDEPGLRDAFRQRFLALGLEALRRNLISKSKLVELAAMVDVSNRELDHLLDQLGLSEVEAEVLSPEGSTWPMPVVNGSS
ncbi:MAG: ImmA/IrrE family metallo-endopeptidase [Acidobacteria bacterium]|nr:MAG: ImmA/IrrE family metallo-endopeptidase [Acidobacteriota bacterium]